MTRRLWLGMSLLLSSLLGCGSDEVSGGAGAAGTGGGAAEAGTGGTSGAAGAGDNALNCSPSAIESICSCQCAGSAKQVQYWDDCARVDGLLCDDGVRYESCTLDHEECTEVEHCIGNTQAVYWCECGDSPARAINDGMPPDEQGLECDDATGTLYTNCVLMTQECPF
jgi:hypothetical protein